MIDAIPIQVLNHCSRLDDAVIKAYGWDNHPNDQILVRLLALNQERYAKSAT